MQDIDFVEYDTNDMPLMAVELKHGNIKYLDFSSHQFKQFRNTANLLQVPGFAVVYYNFSKDHSRLINGDESYDMIHHRQFYVIPINLLAFNLVKEPVQMTEKQYANLIYHMHKLIRPEDGIDNLSTTWLECKLPTIDNYPM